MQVNGIEQKAGIFEPPVKPKITKKMKTAQMALRSNGSELIKALVDQKETIKDQYDYDKQTLAKKMKTASDSEKATFTERKAALKAQYDADTEQKNAEIAEAKKAYLANRPTKSALKKELTDQNNALKAQYKLDKVLWKTAPKVSAEETAKYKSELVELTANAKMRKAKINADAKKERAEIKETYQKSAKTSDDRLAFELAIRHSKDAQRNAKLDIKEELRFNRDKMEKATLSPAKRFKLKKSRARRSAIWRDRWLYVMIFPFFLYFVLFAYLPMPGIILAFKDYSPRKGIWGSPWTSNNGWYNFITFFTQPFAWRVIRNTLVLNSYMILFGFPIPIILALMLNEVRNKMFKTTIQTLSYLPYFVSTVVVCSLVTQFLSLDSGVVNYIYKAISGSDKGIYFLTQPQYFRTIYVIMGIWQGAGFGSIIYVSALVSVDAELYEAARIDGAGRWRQLFSITLPGILPTIAIMLIMRVGNILSLGYESIILLYQPTTYEVADVISTYVYRIGLQQGDASMSTAVSLFNGVVALVMVNMANAVSRKTAEVGLW